MAAATRKSIVIVGGGIAGLAAAYFLVKKTNPDEVAITLIEKERRLGGVISTKIQDGFLIEEGPESLIQYKREAIELARAVGLGSSLIEPNLENNKTFILKNQKLYEIPEGVLGMYSQPFVRLLTAYLKTPLLTFSGKFRLGLEYFVKPKTSTADEPIGRFAERRLGSEFYQSILEPLLTGVYGGDPWNLSMKSLLKKFYEAEQRHGGLIKSALQGGLNDNSSTKIEHTGSVFISLRHGLGSLVEKLAQQLTSVNILLGTTVKEVHKNESGFALVLQDSNQILSADGLVLATPALSTSIMIENFEPLLATRLKEIPYASSTVFSMGFNREDIGHPLKGFGFLASKQAKLNFIACTWSSSKWPGRAPEGKVLLRLYVPNIPKDVEAEQQKVLNQCVSILKIQKPPLFSMTHFHPQSMPLYTVGHDEKLKKIEEIRSRHASFALVGAAYEGVGISDCIRSGANAASIVLSKFQGVSNL